MDPQTIGPYYSGKNDASIQGEELLGKPTAKDRVKQFLDPQNLSDNERESLRMHPQESASRRFFQRKPGAVLTPLSKVFTFGGGAAAISGAIGTAASVFATAVGIFPASLLIIPGVAFTMVGIGGIDLGDKIESKVRKKREKVIDELQQEIPDELPEKKIFQQRLNNWMMVKSKESLIKIKFNILEAEIKHSDLSEEKRIELLEKYAGKHVAKKDYEVLKIDFNTALKEKSERTANSNLLVERKENGQSDQLLIDNTAKHTNNTQGDNIDDTKETNDSEKSRDDNEQWKKNSWSLIDALCADLERLAEEESE